MSVSKYLKLIPVSFAVQFAISLDPKVKLRLDILDNATTPPRKMSCVIETTEEYKAITEGNSLIGRCGYEYSCGNIVTVTRVDDDGVLYANISVPDDIAPFDLVYKERLMHATLESLRSGTDLILGLRVEQDDCVIVQYFTPESIQRRTKDSYEVMLDGQCYEFRYKDIASVACDAGYIFIDHNSTILTPTTPGNVVYASFTP